MELSYIAISFCKKPNFMSSFVVYYHDYCKENHRFVDGFFLCWKRTLKISHPTHLSQDEPLADFVCFIKLFRGVARKFLEGGSKNSKKSSKILDLLQWDSLTLTCLFQPENCSSYLNSWLRYKQDGIRLWIW